MNTLELLVEDLEETLFAMGVVSLFEIRTTARGFAGEATPPELDDLCLQAHASLTSRFALHLEWYRWPPTPIGPAEPGVTLDFDLGDATDVDQPYLVLVPDDEAAVAAELEKQFYPDGRGS